jgi:hypothetical protein
VAGPVVAGKGTAWDRGTCLRTLCRCLPVLIVTANDARQTAPFLLSPDRAAVVALADGTDEGMPTGRERTLAARMRRWRSGSVAGAASPAGCTYLI